MPDQDEHPAQRQQANAISGDAPAVPVVSVLVTLKIGLHRVRMFTEETEEPGQFPEVPNPADAANISISSPACRPVQSSMPTRSYTTGPTSR